MLKVIVRGRVVIDIERFLRDKVRDVLVALLGRHIWRPSGHGGNTSGVECVLLKPFATVNLKG